MYEVWINVAKHSPQAFPRYISPVPCFRLWRWNHQQNCKVWPSLRSTAKAVGWLVPLYIPLRKLESCPVEYIRHEGSSDT